MLGATAEKPPGSGRCDSTWCWNNDLWIALDAKSDHERGGLVPLKDVRQANDQLRLLATARGADVIPPDSIALVVSPKPAVDPNAVAAAEPHVHLTHVDVVHELAETVGRAWRNLLSDRAGRSDVQLRDLVAERLSQHGLLPEQVHDRLTAIRVGELTRRATILADVDKSYTRVSAEFDPLLAERSGGAIGGPAAVES